MEKINVLGVKINNNLTYGKIIDEVNKKLNKHEKLYITTTNPEFVVEAVRRPSFMEVLNNADINTPDGVGVVLAQDIYAKSVRKNQVERAFGVLFGYANLLLSRSYYANKRITGSDLTTKLLEYCNENKKSIAIIGGGYISYPDKITVADKMREVVHNSYPNIVLVAAESKFDAIKDSERISDYINDKVSECRLPYVDVVFIAFGHPKQELWIRNNINKTNGLLFIGVGGTFDFLTGKTKRSSKMFIDHNLEWLYRLIKEPKRLKRIFNATVVFSYLIFKDTVFNKKNNLS